jgi:hypothetical protein
VRLAIQGVSLVPRQCLWSSDRKGTGDGAFQQVGWPTLAGWATTGPWGNRARRGAILGDRGARGWAIEAHGGKRCRSQAGLARGQKRSDPRSAGRSDLLLILLFFFLCDRICPGNDKNQRSFSLPRSCFSRCFFADSRSDLVMCRCKRLVDLRIVANNRYDM